MADDAASDGEFLFDRRCAVVGYQTGSGSLCPELARGMYLGFASACAVDMHIGSEEVFRFEFARTSNSDMGGMAESFQFELASPFGIDSECIDIEL